MKIHLRYTQILLNLGLVDEVHVWDICLDDLDNRDFLYRFAKEANDTRYIIFPNPPENKWRNATKIGQGYLWEAYYNHYATHSRYEDEDIIFKADDDTVFIDVSSFASFLSQITTPNLYFPNIVNNDAGLYVQAKLNAHPTMQHILTAYEKSRIPISGWVDSYYTNTVAAAHKFMFGFVIPLSNWGGGLYTRGDYADQMHKAFLSDPQRFIHNCQNASYHQHHQHHHHHHNHSLNSVNNTITIHNNTDSNVTSQDISSSSTHRLFPVKRRISINMFAGKFAVVRQMYNIYLQHQCCDDEGFVGKWPSLTHLDHIIDSHFVVAHFAFNPQYTAGKHFTEWLTQYDDLSREQYLVHFSEDIFDRKVFESVFPAEGVVPKEEDETKKELKTKEYKQTTKEKQKLIDSYGKRFAWKESLRSTNI
jgi:hypothetical protein